MGVSEEEREILDEVFEEYCRNDPVRRDIRHVYFVSRSKGRGRRRRMPVEVSLLSYRGGPFKLWHRFPFDTVATGCIGDIPDSEAVLIRRLWDIRRGIRR